MSSAVLVIGLVILVNGGGFLLGGALLHWWFYRGHRDQAREWKHQPDRFQNARQMVEKLPLVLLNMTIINGFIGAGVYLMLAGHTRATWTIDGWTTLLATAALFPWYHGMLYYVHRTMHRPALFRRIHYLHHRYKTPIWLDALYEHPIEAVWGGIVLTSPLFLFPVWAPGYFFFVAVVGVHEVLDHAGVNLNLPILSGSRAHDDHRRWSNRFYGQLLPYLDRWHHTDGGPRS